jgi:hypothetical protein
VSDHERYFVGPPDPALEGAQAFVERFWSDADGEGEVRADLLRAADSSPQSIMTGLVALKRVLDDPTKAWALTYLVEVNANHGLDACTEAAARSFLERFVGLAETALRASPSQPGEA